MNVGMLTTHGTMNYGGLLQAYALHHTIEDFGHKATFINYVPNMHDIKRHPIQFVTKRSGFIRKSIFGLRHYGELKKKEGLISAFRKSYIPCWPSTPIELNGLPGAVENYDVVCVGSDQLWNLNQPDNANGAYYLDFDRSTRTVAYGVSFGDGIGKAKEQTVQMLSAVKRFDSVSVRELEGQSFLGEHSIQAEVVLDPTLLASGEVWEPFLGRRPLVDGEYILAYGFSNANQSYSDLISSALYASKATGLPVINPVMTPAMDAAGFTNRYEAGPAEFINLIEHASLVVTSSYHGCIFSFLLERPFVAVFNKTGREPRKDTLLNLIGEGNRKVIAGERFEVAQQMHAPKGANASLMEARSRSRAFLREALAEGNA
ncbi:polysaccharide pyruvyl transferase family protein [Thermophilibacter provencensis]|uniref:Polysaccharide pyruvyl transferase family protein n=1 Tax=Thermophilibacter provencensis TaxID=1852386 RepID=A0ABT7V4Q9_9ACTN|nr:polysaccharide pyruvyl transferase family protein [Thermophilibacter provencensis]MDM8271582.1 polysaccharide pyruvyl transferase family protein [Thermophilibacter provencensis]